MLVLDSVSALLRVKLSAELGSIAAQLQAGSGDKVLLERRMQQIAVELGEQINPIHRPVKADLADVIGTMASMAEYIDAVPESEKPTAAMYMRAAYKYLNKSRQKVDDAVKAAANHLNDKIFAHLREVESEAFKAECFSEITTLGGDVYSLVTDVAQADSETKKNEAEAQAIIDECDQARKPYRAQIDSLFKMVEEASQRAHAAGDQAKVAALRVEFDKQVEELYGKSDSIQNDSLRKLEANRKKVAEVYSDIGKKAIEAVLSGTSVSQDEATQWAEAQEITKQARVKLKKLQYPIESVRKDMAEFHRISRGRLPSIVLSTDGGRRANATGIHGYGDPVINIGSSFNKRVLFHEMAHHLESDPVLLAGSKAFLNKRRQSETPVSLRKITKNKFYDAKEEAYEDGFFDAYVGKVYPDATEVLSMGVESFSDPAVLAKRMAKDPEMFAFIAGTLRSDPHPLYKVIKQLRMQAAEIDAKAEEASESEWDALLQEYIKDVVIEPGQSYGIDVSTLWAVRGVSKLIGGWNGIIFVECSKIRNPKTGRVGKGIAIIIAERDSVPPRYNSASYSFEGIDYARAVARAKNNGSLFLAYGDTEKLRSLLNGIQ